VYVTGLSNGAFMTSSVACRYADRVAAIAPVAGIRDPEGCDPARPVPVLAIHGTDDQFVTYEGGLGERALDLPAPDGSGRTLREVGVESRPPGEPSVPEIAAAWAARNGCGDADPPEAVTDDVDRIVHRCPPGVAVELLRVEGGGHAWPGSALSAAVESIVGPTTMTISANEQLWAFFRDHPLPAR
jgi:polyhydroxybutyrate depolymerase